MRTTTRTAVAVTAAGVAVAALLSTAGPAAADGSAPTSGATAPAAGATAEAPQGDGARALCRRLPQVDARVDRALARLNGPVTRRGSVARLQQRVDNANDKGDTAVATYLKDRLAFRKSLVPTLTQRSTDLDAVRTWCDTQHFPAKKKGGTAK